MGKMKEIFMTEREKRFLSQPFDPFIEPEWPSEEEFQQIQDDRDNEAELKYEANKSDK